MAKILVVDDQEDILFLVEQTLTQAGHRVFSASDPRRVLPLARNGRFDAIVLDIMMPEISGWNLLLQLRELPETRKTPVVFLSARSSVSDRVRGLRSGADDYLTKPFEPAELVARLEGLIERRAAPAALQGQLEDHSLEEVLQQLEQGRKSGRLELVAGPRSGEIHFDAGSIVGARQAGLEGEEAVLGLLDLKVGGFVFESLRQAPGGPRRIAKAVSPLLIHSAWIDDEFGKRREHIPADGARHRLRGEVPDPPAHLPDLPLQAIVPALTRDRGIEIDELITTTAVAPRRLRLALAWLGQEGLLEPVDGSPEVPAEPEIESLDERDAASEAEVFEAFDVAVRELLQAAHFRGLALDRIRIEVRLPEAHGPCWQRLRATLPNSIAPRSLADPPATWVLSHPAGAVEVRVAPYGNGSPGAGAIDLGELARDAVGVVLWLDPATPAASLTALGRSLVNRCPKAGGVLLTDDPEVRGAAEQRLGDGLRWRIPASPPASWSDLLLELAQTDPDGDARS